ncbi:hypothetical protein ACOCJ4_11865 [Knoellia sp. CPCC 206435]|uniref:hypothetical protein n=1 Tax=Knoellia terrae TaxID=3404797 RepID=UPI003B43425B
MSTMTRISRGVAATGVAGLMSLGLATTAFADHIDPPSDSAANQAENWVDYVEAHGYSDVVCKKITEGWEGDTWTSDADYALVALKAGSDQSSDGGPHTITWDVEEGDTLMTEDEKEISHIIACTGEKETPTSTPTTSTPGTSTPPGPTGPVVETDIPESGGSSLPTILGGAALLAGLGITAGAMRRKGQH